MTVMHLPIVIRIFTMVSEIILIFITKPITISKIINYTTVIYCLYLRAQLLIVISKWQGDKWCLV